MKDYFNITHIIYKGLVCFMFFGSCTSKYEGFHEITPGLWRKVHIIGDESKPVEQGDMVKLSMTLETLGQQKIMSDTGVYMFLDNTDDTDMQEAISRLVVGDSATYVLQRPNPFQEDEITDVLFSVKITGKMSKEEYDQMVADYILRSEKKEMEEIMGYLEKHEEEKWKRFQGMYYQQLDVGKGIPVEKGNKIAIHYKGWFLNGKVFDSTYEVDDPQYFVFGDPGQVIEGFEIMLWKMRKGAKSKIILPSYLAFGIEGSANGKIPPFTPVMYEIEVIKNFK